MPLFDTHIVVDWSANGTPKTGKDSIWIAVHQGGRLRLSNPSTRHAAMAQLSHHLQTGSRVLIGCDFAFGYPRGTAQQITGQGWQALWARIAAEITDDTQNANNRFAAAARLNAHFPNADGPFWGHPHQHAGRYPGLGPKKPAGYGTHLPPNQRLTDAQAKGAQEVWKLTGVGAVGGQTLMGIAHLERLRHQYPLAIWPFEQTSPTKPHLAAEVFPSLLPPDPSEAIRDAGQVRALATALARLDAENGLAPLLSLPKSTPPQVTHEEGAILGLHHKPHFQASLVQKISPPEGRPETQAEARP